MKVFGNFSLRQKNSFFFLPFSKREGKMVEREKKNYQQVIFSLLFSSFFTDTEKRGNLWSPRVSLSSLLFVLIFLVARKTLDTNFTFPKDAFSFVAKIFSPEARRERFCENSVVAFVYFFPVMSQLLFFVITQKWKFSPLPSIFWEFEVGWGISSKVLKGERDSQQ